MMRRLCVFAFGEYRLHLGIAEASTALLSVFSVFSYVRLHSYLCRKELDMATLIRYPAEMCFSSDIADIVFSTSSESGLLVLDLVCGGTAMNVMEERVYPEVDGSIAVSDLSELVEPYAREYLQVVLRCSFSDDAGAVSIPEVTVLFSMADVDTTAADFTENHFLSILSGEKVTAMGREERLHVWGDDVVTLRADVLLSDGGCDTRSVELTEMDSTGNVCHFDVSPANVSALLGLTTECLLSYTVESGSRSQDYLVMEDQVPPAPSLLFINSFGFEEFLHCVGTHKKDSKYEREQARMLGRLRNYRITEERRFTANTGWLNEAMADWADDLFRSESVFLWVDGKVGREVVLSDSKSEISNEDDHMPAFEFTYTYAQRIHNVMQSGRVGRIFDNTFDRTFN